MDQYKNIIATILWHDILERLDILLMEARHLQVNIIYTLNAPELHQPLRDEEEKIFYSGRVNESEDGSNKSTDYWKEKAITLLICP